MPRVALTASTAAGWGGGILDITPTAVNTPDGNSFVNTGVEKIVVANGSGGTVTVTVAIPASARSLNGLITQKTYAIAATKTAVLGPFEPSIFNQPTGFVHVDWSSGTSVTAAVVTHVPTPG